MLDHVTELREMLCLLVYYIIQDMIKDTDEQPGKEKHGARSGSIPSVGAGIGMCSLTQKLSESYTLGFL